MKYILLILLLAATGLWACKKKQNAPAYEVVANDVGLELGRHYTLILALNGALVMGNQIVFNNNSTITEIFGNDSTTYRASITPTTGNPATWVKGGYALKIAVPGDTVATNSYFFYSAAAGYPNDTVVVGQFMESGNWQLACDFLGTSGGYIAFLSP